MGECGSHWMGLHKQTTCPRNIWRIAHGRCVMCTVAPSCWNQKLPRLCSARNSSIFVLKKFSSLSSWPISVHSNGDSTLLKKVRLNDAYRWHGTPNSDFWAVKRSLVKFLGVSYPVTVIADEDKLYRMWKVLRVAVIDTPFLKKSLNNKRVLLFWPWHVGTSNGKIIDNYQ